MFCLAFPANSRLSNKKRKKGLNQHEISKIDFYLTNLSFLVHGFSGIKQGKYNMIGKVFACLTAWLLKKK